MFNKKVKKLYFMFKASENNFDMKKYYKECGHLTNTIVICKTNANKNNKIIGGYTPLSFSCINDIS